MIKVMFVCLGNICRSPMAEFLARDMAEKLGIADKYCFASSATSDEEVGNPVHPGTKRKLASLGISTGNKRAMRLTKADYNEYDYIIAMEDSNISDIYRIIGDDPDKKVCKLLDFTGKSRNIADPWYTGNFDVTYDDIKEGLTAFFKYNGEIK